MARLLRAPILQATLCHPGISARSPELPRAEADPQRGLDQPVEGALSSLPGPLSVGAGAAGIRRGHAALGGGHPGETAGAAACPALRLFLPFISNIRFYLAPLILSSFLKLWKIPVLICTVNQNPLISVILFIKKELEKERGASAGLAGTHHPGPHTSGTCIKFCYLTLHL